MEDALERARKRPETIKKLAFVSIQLATAYAAAGHLAKAEALRRTNLQDLRTIGPNEPQTAFAMVSFGLFLSSQERYAEAEPQFRDGLAVFEKTDPSESYTFYVRSLLGQSLLEQRKYAEAEPFLIAGYEGMKARENMIPEKEKPKLAEAGQRLAKLYKEWGRPEKAEEWRKKLDAKLPDLPANVFGK